MLYLLNDILHHTKYHEETTSGFSLFSASIQPYLVDLIGLAASYDRRKAPKHHHRLSDLLYVWENDGYYGKDYVNKLFETIENYASPDTVKPKPTSLSLAPGPEKDTVQKDPPYVMPNTHGDPSAPYYELPAGNFMPHIIPNSPIPIRPESVKPLQFLAGPADRNLVDAVKKLLKDVEMVYANGTSDDPGSIEIDELGQIIMRDEDTGEPLDGEAYYGWSRSFCQKMKKRRGEKPASRESSQSQSRSRSRSRSYTPRNRMRYSDSMSDDDRGRSGSRGSSTNHKRRRCSSYSRSPYSSRSPPRRRPMSPSRSRSYSPRPSSPQRFQQQQQRPQFQEEAQTPFPPPMQYPFNGYPPHQQFPPAGMFIPPRPPNYNGPWPPPPPPPPPPQHNTGGSPFPPMNMGIGMNMPGFMPPQAPFQQFPAGAPQFFTPPLPPQQQPGAYQYPPPSPAGRGHHYGDGNAGRGRGGHWGSSNWR